MTMSNDDGGRGNEGAEAAPAPAGRPPKLRREAVVFVHDRGRSAIFAGALALAGVGLGFGLANLGSMGMRGCPGPARPAHAAALEVRAQEMAWLGVHVKDHGHASADAGAEVLQVFAGSAAERIGLARGVVIASIDGRPTPGAGELVAAVRERSPGDPVSLSYVDAVGDSHDVTVVLGGIDERRFAAYAGRHGRRGGR